MCGTDTMFMHGGHMGKAHEGGAETDCCRGAEASLEQETHTDRGRAWVEQARVGRGEAFNLERREGLCGHRGAVGRAALQTAVRAFDGPPALHTCKRGAAGLGSKVWRMEE